MPFVSQEGLVSQENKQANVVQSSLSPWYWAPSKLAFTLVQVLARVLLPHKFLVVGPLGSMKIIQD